MDAPKHILQARLNTVLKLNLLCLLMHFVLYGSTQHLLLGLHNPFADFLVMLSIVSLVGLWLCFDFLMPVLCESVRKKEQHIAKPIGWIMALSLFAFIGGITQLIPSLA